MADFTPYFNNICILICLIEHFHIKRINFIFQRNDGQVRFVLMGTFNFHNFKLKSHITIIMLHCQSNFRRAVQPINRISCIFAFIQTSDSLKISIRQLGAIIYVFQLSFFWSRQY